MIEQRHGRYFAQELMLDQSGNIREQIQDALDAGEIHEWHLVHRAGAANQHDGVIRFDARPLYCFIFDHVKHDGYLGSDLQRDAAEFSLALAGVAVAGVEERPIVPHGQVDGVSGLHVRHVHVTPEGAGGKGGYRFEVGSYSQGSQEGLRGQFHAELLVDQLAATVREVPDPDSLGQRVLERPGEVR